MKQLTSLLFFVFISQVVFGQVSGNINYQNQVRYSSSNISVDTPVDADLFISVKGLANVKADAYVAIFNVTQVGKTTGEVNDLLDERIKRAIGKYKENKSVEIYIDMVSFVPVYEYEVEKKVFSKKTYNEVPAGFELKKNLHIKYTNPDLLNEIIADFSVAEIYDLIRVDYFSEDLEAQKKELQKKAKDILQDKLKNYEDILKLSLDSVEKSLSDGYRVVLPVEMYQSYQAYNSSSLNLKKSAKSNPVEKSKTLYYQPVVDKEFDFVINPTVLEPVIQVMYEIKLRVNRQKNNLQKTNKEFYLVTPSGELKELKLK